MGENIVKIVPSGKRGNGDGKRVLFSVGFNIANTDENAELIAVYKTALSDIAKAFLAMPEYAGFVGNTSNLTKGMIKYARDKLAEEAE